MKTLKSLFKLGGTISSKLSTYVGIIGFFFLMAVWYLITTATGWVKPQTIPIPSSVIFSFSEFIAKDKYLNWMGYRELIIVLIILAIFIVPGMIKNKLWVIKHAWLPKFLKQMQMITEYLFAIILIVSFIILLVVNFIPSESSFSANLVYSIRLNVWGYIKAIAISIPLGFLIALIPLVKSMFSKYVDALRYVPLTGLIGVFIAWFGIGATMKIDFLAFGIIVYLLPMVVLRVLETEQIHLDTLYTLGAKRWQLLTKVYWPSAISKLSSDIRVITAISWTYIIVAEMQNNEGGVGAMVYRAQKQTRMDWIFVIILVIIIVGFLQDILLQWLDKKMFKHKHIK